MSGPFTAAWGNEIQVMPEPTPEPEIEVKPVQLVEDGFYWLSYDSPSGWGGNPVHVIGGIFLLPGSSQRYSVQACIERMGAKFIPLLPIEVQP
jgi:hypothetical protein